MANLEEFVGQFRALTSGQNINYEGADAQLVWAQHPAPPVWVAGYGPIALTAAGRIADGIILQFADPFLIKWCLQFVKQGAEMAGRDYSKIKIMAAAPVWIDDDLPKAREIVRWFPALVSNHVVDLLKKYPQDELPPELTDYVRERPEYNYLHHAEVGSSNGQFVPDDIVDRYCVVGGVKEQIRRLEELQSLGVHQFNIYLMCGDEEKQVAIYKNKIIPHFNAPRRAKPAAKAPVKKAVAKKKPAAKARAR
jgi:alkanesulfonate monooxygenase SsuD/methylene tetrahydromethanopterin reductase-like flavin-dependent oxidoreductase (luciferase family)